MTPRNASEAAELRARLAVLESYDILDTEAEAGFDDIVLLASQICETPIALVTLVAGDRQWFKAKFGFDGCETPIGQSVCQHGLRLPGLLIIPDLTIDSRTRNNTLVTGEPHLRFYAGARLETQEGLGFGMLCVIDTRPRPEGLTPTQAKTLEALARQVMLQMELRRTVAVRDKAAVSQQQQAALLRTITDHVSEAVFQLDTAGLVTFANPAAAEMLGWNVEELLGQNLHDIAHHHHADGRVFPSDACELVQALPVGGIITKRETVFFNRNGAPIDVLVSNSPVSQAGSIVGAVLTIVNVTATKAAVEDLRRADERLNFAMQASAVGWWDWDIPNDKIYASENFARLYSVDPKEAAAGTSIAKFIDAIHPDDQAYIQAKIEDALRTAGEFAEEYRVVDSDGFSRWVDARGRCYWDDHSKPVRYPGVAVDITERKRSEDRQTALVDLGDRVRNLSNPAEIVYVAAEIAGWTLGLSGAAYGMVDLGLATITFERDWQRGDGQSIAGRHKFSDYGSYLDELLRGDTVAITDIESDPRVSASMFRALGIRSFLNIPLLEHGRLVAVFCLLDSRPRNWSNTKLDFMRSVTDRTRAALRELQAENEQKLLNQELSHRMKNLLAMVQAIANQTMRSAVDVKTASNVLSGRLIALSRAHDLLVGGRAGDTMLEPIVRGAVASHGDRPERFVVEGPAVRIGAKAAMAFALMVHELATNATKYGALSNDLGHVEIDWRIATERSGDILILSWTERDGPTIVSPTSKGFGSRFIERALATQIGGAIEIEYPPSGLVCIVRGLLENIQANE